MELDTLDILITALAILSAIWAFISEQFRLPAVVIAFTFLAIAVISKQNKKIDNISFEHNKLKEKLKIHQQLIDIKSDIKYLQRATKYEK